MVKAISIRQIEGKPGKVYYPLEHINIPDNAPKENEVVVKITAAALSTPAPPSVSHSSLMAPASSYQQALHSKQRNGKASA
jgi:hypothetical protein